MSGQRNVVQVSKLSMCDSMRCGTPRCGPPNGNRQGNQKTNARLSGTASNVVQTPLTSECLTASPYGLESIWPSGTPSIASSLTRDHCAVDIPYFEQVYDDNNCSLVTSRISFVLSAAAPEVHTVEFPVSLHVYDLSEGLLHRHSQKLMGVYVKGVYHSAVVCYGMEFFFEGGVAIVSAGRSRFGETFEKVEMGSTSKSLNSFITWVRQRESDTYSFISYHPTEHNCHTFSADALNFLVGPEASIPSYLTDTIRTLVKTPMGSGVVEAMVHFPQGANYVIADKERKRMSERRVHLQNVKERANREGIKVLPPVGVILFTVNDPVSCYRAFAAVEPFAKRLRQHEVIGAETMNSIERLKSICAGAECVDSNAVSEYVKLITHSLAHTTRVLWGPVLNSLRVAILHKVVLCTCVFDPYVLAILSEGACDFLSLTADGKLALLRLLCNMAGDIHGAAALNCVEYSETWVAVVGQALMDYQNPVIVYTGAALAVNLAVTFVLTEDVASKDIVSSNVTEHCRQLVTVLLYYLGKWPRGRMPEAAVTLMLFSLFTILLCDPHASRVVRLHPFKPDFDVLINEERTKENITIIHLLRDLTACPRV